MSTFKVVVKKEFKTLFRGGVSLIVSLILPLILMPLLITIILKSNENEDANVNSPKIALFIRDGGAVTCIDKQSDVYKDELAFILDNVLYSLEPALVKVDDVEKAFSFEDINLALYVDSDLLTKINSGYFNIDVVYNVSFQSSVKFSAHILQLIGTFSAAITELRLNSIGLNGSDFVAVAYNSTTIQKFQDKKTQGLNNPLLITLVPTIIIGFISFGSMTASSELFSLEKERNTLESLLSTSGSRKQIVLGKVFVNLIFSLAGAALQLLSLLLAYLLNIKSFSDTIVYFKMETIVCLFLGLISLSILAAILNVLVFVFSKNNRGASAYSAILMLLPIVISYFIMSLSPAGINIWEMFIPFLGTVLALRMAIVGAVSISYLLISSVINLALSGLLTYFIIKRYCSEKIFKID